MAVQQSPIYIKANTSDLPIVGAQPGNGLTVDASNRLLMAPATTGDGGAMSAADKSKLDSITPANIPTADQKAALVGAGSPPASGNPYATAQYVDAAVNAVSGEYGAPVQTIALLRAIPYSGVPDKQLRLVEDVGALYRYDTAGTGADDGVGTILPTGNAGNGRWFKVQAATQDHEALTGLLGGASADHQHLTTAQVGQLPSSGEKSALAGTSGTPGSGNKFVTDGDSRLTNARPPSAHANSHASGGSDAITVAQSQVTGLTTDLAAKVPATRTVAGHALSGDVTLAKADVGLGDCDNTDDANKPVSTATQAALDGKGNVSGQVFTGAITAKKSATTTNVGHVGVMQSTVVPGGQTFTFTPAAAAKLFIVADAGFGALVFVDLASSTVTILANPSGMFVATSTPDSGHHGIFKDAWSDAVSIKNGLASTRTISVLVLGSVSAVTDPA